METTEAFSVRRLRRGLRVAMTDPRRALHRLLVEAASHLTDEPAPAPEVAAVPGVASPPAPAFDRLDFNASYRAHVAELKAQSASKATALQQAIGGEFDANGKLMRDLLIAQGLAPDGYVIDVGCGSGRLARPLAAYLTSGRYFGLDVVPDLVEHARAITQRPDWRFEVTSGRTIAEADGQADLVCFFSVLTHLLHEESYEYLREAKRVLKPGGKIVFSFLEFHVYSHWAVFEENIRQIGKRLHLNQFMSRDGISAWAHHLGLEVQAIDDGDKPHIPLREPVVLEDGRRMEGLGNLGQSVCVLVKP